MKRHVNNFLIRLILIVLFFTVGSLSVNAEKKDILQEVDPMVKLLGDSLSNRANVAPDPDEGRLDFNQTIDNPETQETPTTVTVKPADQITNLATYKKEAKANGTYVAVDKWEELKSVYSDNTKTYIEVTSDITAAINVATRDLGWRETSIIIDGGGHTINMAGAAFNVGTNSTVRGAVFTLTNVDLIHWESGTSSGNSTQADGVIDSRNLQGGYGYWHYNLDNITLEGRDGKTGTVANSHPRRLLDAEDSQVRLSGNIVVAAKQELMQIGQVDIVNKAHVELQRTVGTTGYSMFYYMGISANNSADTGYAHSFTVGDGATIDAKELSTYHSNGYPLVYYGYNSITVGDNVTWSQDGFQMLLDLSRYVGTNANNRLVTFGQNLSMKATRTVGKQALYASRSAVVTFNAGTVLDLQQWNNDPVVRTDAGSTMTFISPKSLNISRNNASGEAATGALFTGPGTFSMNNSQISTWQGSDSKESTPEGNRNLKFAKMTVSGSKATVTDTAGNTSSSDIVDDRTRELSTNSIEPGTVKLNYLDQYGNKLTTVNYPVSSDENYIGQYLSIKTKEYATTQMPPHYMWALAGQVPKSAVSDAQSGGDTTTNADDGDKYGQANVAIVPMEGSEYVYNIYVYGVPNSQTQYAYKDLKSGKVLTSEFLNTEKEKAGTSLTPANYKNKINWADPYYTVTNLPLGFHYATSKELESHVQPQESIVGLAPELTTLFAYPDKQTVIVTFENLDGSPLENQISPISIDGYSGKEVSYNDLVSGKITQEGSEAEEGTFIFDYTDNKGSEVDKTPQQLTIKLKYNRSNMTLKQVYQGTDDPIYSDLIQKTPVDNSPTYEETSKNNLEAAIKQLITDKKFTLNYDGYDTVSLSAYKVYKDGVEITPTPVTIPVGDFTVVYEYVGQLRFKEVAKNLDFGSIRVSKDSSTTPLTEASDKSLSIINTVQNSTWKLKAAIPAGITKIGSKKQAFLGDIIYKNATGVPQIIGQSVTEIETQTDHELLSQLELKQADRGLLLKQYSGNLQGNYDGTLVWTLEDSPEINHE
ncbi:pectate lyase-like adhesive domain-containing protein [Vagococcus sp.]|uniref:pectate lyase-like adhesive domain-containing protein n=1 Tax=Vagococcus sp. TaxID=1933889 RepID=UPI003F97963E